MIYSSICITIIVATFSMYILSDGKVLAMCCMLPFCKEREKGIIFNNLLPSWDANQTWLVYTLAALYGAFSTLFADIFSNLYLQFIAMLVLFIIRGSAIEFSMKDKKNRKYWHIILATASCTILFLQSYIVSSILLNQQEQIYHRNISITGLYYFVVILSFLLFHICRASNTIYHNKNHWINRYAMYVLPVSYCISLAYFNHLFNTATLPCQNTYLEVGIIMGSAILLNFTKIKNKVDYLSLGLYLLTLTLCIINLFPFIDTISHIKATNLASSNIDTKIISIASLILLPSIFLGITVLTHILKNSNDLISY